MSVDQQAPFWMVYGMGQRAPTFKHPHRLGAENEAKRLAVTSPGIEFVVMEAKRSFTAPSPTLMQTDFVELPF